jgi:hypothetical protein
MWSRVLRAAPLAIMFAGLAGCAALTVRSYTAIDADVRRYQTYAWGPPSVASTGDPRLDGNRFFDEHVRRRIDAELTRRGLEKVDRPGPSSLIVHYHASVSQKIDLRNADAPSSSAEDEGGPYVYDAGTLVIDLLDGRTNIRVWRG